MRAVGEGGFETRPYISRPFRLETFAVGKESRLAREGTLGVGKGGFQTRPYISRPFQLETFAVGKGGRLGAGRNLCGWQGRV